MSVQNSGPAGGVSGRACGKVGLLRGTTETRHSPAKPRGQAPQMKRRPPAPFDLCRKRVREIAVIVIFRHRGLPDTDDRDIYLKLVAHHLKPRDRDLAFALTNWARRLGAKLPQREVDEIVQEVKRKPLRFKADTIGKKLHLTYAERAHINATSATKITTIGCCDVSKAGRVKLRNSLKQEARRRRRGLQSRAQYLACAKSRRRPWIAEGISRRTWYYRQRAIAQVRTSPIFLSSPGVQSCANSSTTKG